MCKPVIKTSEDMEIAPGIIMSPQDFRGHFEISIMKKWSNKKFDFSNLNALRSKKVDIPQKIILKTDYCT